MGVPGAFTATDAEGSEGSDAGVAKALAGGGFEDATGSCGCLEQAASVNSNADDKTNGADFMSWLSKSSTVLQTVSTQHLPQRIASSRLWARIRRMTGQPGLPASRWSLVRR